MWGSGQKSAQTGFFERFERVAVRRCRWTGPGMLVGGELPSYCTLKRRRKGRGVSPRSLFDGGKGDHPNSFLTALKKGGKGGNCSGVSNHLKNEGGRGGSS